MSTLINKVNILLMQYKNIILEIPVKIKKPLQILTGVFKFKHQFLHIWRGSQ